MRIRDAMALRLSKSARIGALIVALTPPAWPWQAVQAQGPDEGKLEMALAGETLTLEARSVPLDRLLEGLAETFQFTVLTRCGAAGCPVISGRLTGGLDEVLGWLLLDHGHSRTYGPATTTGAHPKLRRLVVLSGESGRTGPNAARQPEDRATLGSNQDAGLAELMRWARRLSPGTGLARPAQGAGLGRPGLAEAGAPRLRHAPLPGYRVTSDFGPRSDPLNGRGAWHEGVDLAAPADTRVLSAAPGIVLSAGRNGAYGIMVEVDHGAGVATRYAHLSRALVRPGQRVTGGGPLGVIGASGRSTGRHLHFEVRIEDRPVDPMKFLAPKLPAAARRVAPPDTGIPDGRHDQLLLKDLYYMVAAVSRPFAGHRR